MSKPNTAIAIAVYAAFAVAHVLLHSNGAFPYVFLSGDAANIATFAAGWQFHSLLGADNVLADLDNLRYYLNIHVPLLQALRPVFGDFGTAACALVPLHVFIQALGFYLLGRALFRDQTFALLLGLVSLIPVLINLGTWWGVHRDALPRTSFQALLPYLLLFTHRNLRRPGRWPWIMAAAGLLVYVHAPGTLVWAPAIWLALWAFLPAEWPWRRRLGWMALLGLVFAVFFAPFALNYMDTRQASVDPSVLEAARAIFRERLSPGFLNIFVALAGFLSPAMIVLLLAAGVVWTRLFRLARARGDVEDRKGLLFVALLAGGLVFGAVLTPMADQAVAALRGAFPVQIDLVRGLRFFIALAEIVLVWGLARWAMARPRLRPALVGLLCLVVLGGFGEFIGRQAKPMLAGSVLRMTPEQRAKVDMLDAVARLVPPGEAVLPLEFDGLAVRYYSLRPVVHTWKDGGLLGMTDPARLLAWWDVRSRLPDILELPDDAERLEAMAGLARELGAGWLLLDRKLLGSAEPGERMELAHANPLSALLRLEP